MRAYVTGGCYPPVTTREKQRCVRATAASRHVVWGELDGSRHTSGATVVTHAPLGGGVSRGRARVKAGDACGVLPAPRRLRWQRSRAAGSAMVPVVLTGRANAKIAAAHGHRAAPATLRLHLDVSIRRQAQDRYVAKDALASDRGT